MISEALAKVTTDIAKLNYHLIEIQKQARISRENEAKFRHEAEGLEKNAVEYELKVDQLQIEMRRILNGEPSDVPVEMPVFDEDQVGRIG